VKLRSLAGRAKEKMIERRLPTVIELKDFDDRGVRFVAKNLVEYYRVTEHGFETTYTREMLAALRPDDVLWDIGANVGMVSLHAARTCETYAFEPDPEFSEHLAASAALNDGLEINLQRIAISDSDGPVTLFSDGASGNSPSLVRQRAEKNAITVSARSLDSLAVEGNLPLPSVVKLDIEGAEILALRGGAELLSDGARGPRALLIEVHDEFLPGFDSSAEEVLALLDDYGFQQKAYEANRFSERHLMLER